MRLPNGASAGARESRKDGQAAGYRAAPPKMRDRVDLFFRRMLCGRTRRTHEPSYRTGIDGRFRRRTFFGCQSVPSPSKPVLVDIQGNGR